MLLRRTLVHAPLLAIALSAAAAPPALSAADQVTRKVDAWVLDTASRGDTEFLVMLREQADLRGAGAIARKGEKGAFVLDALRSEAAVSQAPLLAFLKSRGAEFRAYWVANAVWVRGGRDLVDAIAARGDVLHVYANPRVRLSGPVERHASPPDTPEGIEWNVSKVRAPQVWALGITGQGVAD